MMWMRLVVVGMLSVTAVSIFAFQFVESFNAFFDMFKNK
ncbi:hypothetical protein ABMB67_002462 [Halalkalibacter oceani]